MNQAVVVKHRATSRPGGKSRDREEGHLATSSNTKEFTSLDDYFFSGGKGAVIDKHASRDVIRAAQAQLKAVFSEKAPLIDGLYDEKMQGLVRRFQQIHQKSGLRVTGIIDDQTYFWMKRVKANLPATSDAGKPTAESEASPKADDLNEVRLGRKVIGPRSDPYLVNKLRDILIEKHSDLIKEAGKEFGFTELPKGVYGREISLVIGEIQKRAGFTEKGIPGKPGTKWDSLVGKVTLDLIEKSGTAGRETSAVRPPVRTEPISEWKENAEQPRVQSTPLRDLKAATPSLACTNFECLQNLPPLERLKAVAVMDLIRNGKDYLGTLSNDYPERYGSALMVIHSMLNKITFVDSRGIERPYFDLHNKTEESLRQFTDDTAEAVSLFQKHRGLVMTKTHGVKYELAGIIDKKTMKVLLKEHDKILTLENTQQPFLPPVLREESQQNRENGTNS